MTDTTFNVVISFAVAFCIIWAVICLYFLTHTVKEEPSIAPPVSLRVEDIKLIGWNSIPVNTSMKVYCIVNVTKVSNDNYTRQVWCFQ